MTRPWAVAPSRGGSAGRALPWLCAGPLAGPGHRAPGSAAKPRQSHSVLQVLLGGAGWGRHSVGTAQSSPLARTGRPGVLVEPSSRVQEKCGQPGPSWACSARKVQKGTPTQRQTRAARHGTARARQRSRPTGRRFSGLDVSLMDSARGGAGCGHPQHGKPHTCIPTSGSRPAQPLRPPRRSRMARGGAGRAPIVSRGVTLLWTLR